MNGHADGGDDDGGDGLFHEACFPNAPPPVSSLHNGEGGLECGVWEHKGIIRTKKMLVAETDKMLYMGQPFLRNPSK